MHRVYGDNPNIICDSFYKVYINGIVVKASGNEILLLFKSIVLLLKIEFKRDSIFYTLFVKGLN